MGSRVHAHNHMAKYVTSVSSQSYWRSKTIPFTKNMSSTPVHRLTQQCCLGNWVYDTVLGPCFPPHLGKTGGVNTKQSTASDILGSQQLWRPDHSETAGYTCSFGPRVSYKLLTKQGRLLFSDLKTRAKRQSEQV